MRRPISCEPAAADSRAGTCSAPVPTVKVLARDHANKRKELRVAPGTSGTAMCPASERPKLPAGWPGGESARALPGWTGSLGMVVQVTPWLVDLSSAAFPRTPTGGPRGGLSVSPGQAHAPGRQRPGAVEATRASLACGRSCHPADLSEPHRSLGPCPSEPPVLAVSLHPM